MFGAEEFSREIGLPLVREGEAQDLIYARSATVIAATSAQVQVVDGVWVDLNNTDGLWGICSAVTAAGIFWHVVNSPIPDRSH